MPPSASTCCSRRATGGWCSSARTRASACRSSATAAAAAARRCWRRSASGSSTRSHQHFVLALNATNCNGCSKCVDACPVEALSLVSANDPKMKRRKVARLSEDLCLGCGVCVGTCPKDCVRLEPRHERVITPLNSAHRVVLQAIERGQLQDLIYDNRALASHRAMAAILGSSCACRPPSARWPASRSGRATSRR